MVACMALDTPVSLAWAPMILVWYVVYKSSYSQIIILGIVSFTCNETMQMGLYYKLFSLGLARSFFMIHNLQTPYCYMYYFYIFM